MSGVWKVIPCPGCFRRWWKRGCHDCGGRERIAVALTQRELAEMAYSTFSGDLYRTKETAEAAIRRMG